MARHPTSGGSSRSYGASTPKLNAGWCAPGWSEASRRRPFSSITEGRPAFASIRKQDRASCRPGQRGDKTHQPAQFLPRHGHASVTQPGGLKAHPDHRALYPPGPGGSEGSGAPIASAREEGKIMTMLYSMLSFPGCTPLAHGVILWAPR